MQVQCNRVKIIPIVIGALATIIKSTNRDFHQLKLHQNHDALQMIVSTGLVNILNNHF